MKALHSLGVFLVVTSAICTARASDFEVDLINPSRAYLLVDGAWQQNAECLQVKVSVTTEVSAPVLKSYFYGSEGKLLETINAPSRETDGQGNQIRTQTKFEKGRKYEVYFGIPEAAKKWKRAIIVFGKPGDYATKIYPKDDLAKFDFPEKLPAIPTQEKVTVSVPQHFPPPVEGKPIPEVLALKTPFQAQVKQEVEQPYNAGVQDLNARYIAALDRAQETAQKSGKLEEAVAIRSDKEAVASGNGVPATDDETTTPVVKHLRSTYRVAIGRLESERARRLEPLRASFARSLDALVVSLTKDGKLEEALAVKREREHLTSEPVAGPTMLGKAPTYATAGGSSFPSDAPQSNHADNLPESLERPVSSGEATLPKGRYQPRTPLIVGSDAEKKRDETPGTLHVVPGTEFEGASLFARKGLITGEHTLFKDCKLTADFLGTFEAKDCLFSESSFKKGGRGNTNLFSSKWMFQNCAFSRTFFSEWPVASVGVKIDRCTFHEVEFVPIVYRQDAGKEVAMEWLSIRNCRFIDCVVPTSFFIATKDCVFENCRIIPAEDPLPISTPIKVQYYAAGAMGLPPAPPNCTYELVELQSAPKDAGSNLSYQRAGQTLKFQ